MKKYLFAIYLTITTDIIFIFTASHSGYDRWAWKIASDASYFAYMKHNWFQYCFYGCLPSAAIWTGYIIYHLTEKEW